jgi:hypothetical protein
MGRLVWVWVHRLDGVHRHSDWVQASRVCTAQVRTPGWGGDVRRSRELRSGARENTTGDRRGRRDRRRRVNPTGEDSAVLPNLLGPLRRDGLSHLRWKKKAIHQEVIPPETDMAPTCPRHYSHSWYPWTEAVTLAHPREGKETSEDGPDIIDEFSPHCLYSAAATSASSIISKGYGGGWWTH